ncbi:MAG: putative membrane protein [Glaciecola sp.]
MESILVKAFAISLVAIILCFGFMDALWLGVIAADIYQQEMQGMLRSSYPVWPWLTFYLIYASSIAILAVQPSLKPLMQEKSCTKSIMLVASRGFILGLAAYGAYNLTNYAILQNWSLKISLIDWTWGCIITSCSATFAAFCVKTFSIISSRS